MKRPTITNDNMVSVYSGRTYFSPSPKTTMATYQKVLGMSFNSPKSESQKTFMLNQSQKMAQDLLRSSSKSDKKSFGIDSRLLKNQSDKPETYTRTPGTNSTYGVLSGSTRPATKLRGASGKTQSVGKTKGEVLSASAKQYSVPKYFDSMNVKDALLKQIRPKNLEIDTDIQTFSSTGGLKAFSTKHTDYKTKLYANNSTNSFTNNMSLDYNTKYGNLSSTGNMKFESIRTDPGDEKMGLTPNNKQKNVLNRILANTNEKSRSALIKKPPLEDNRMLINQPSPPNSLKINNFFASSKRKELESSISKKDKSLNMSIPMENEKEEVTRSVELNKNASNKMRQDHRTTYKAILDQEDLKEDYYRRNEQDSKNLSLSYISSSVNNLPTPSKNDGKPTQPTTQKSGLNSFITKVEKGSVFPVKIKKEDDREGNTVNSPNTRATKNLSESKTTSNAESKTITFSKNNKINQQALASSSQESVNVRGGRSRGNTPGNRDQDSLMKSPHQDNGFTYYITSLEKHHRRSNESDYFCQIYKEHFIQSFQALSFCKYLRSPTTKVLSQKKVYLPKRASHKDCKTVIFDLDETLIHCNESSDVPSDIILPIRFPNGDLIEAGINIRPYAMEILKELSQHFEIIVFTASHSCYANVVLDYLDPAQQYIHHRLFRESCVVTDEGVYIKDLRILANRNMHEMVLVDNAAYSFGFQIENGIPIIPYYENKDDQELKHLIPYIKALNNVKDVRDVNKQTFKLHTYANYDALEKVLNKVVLQN